MGLLSGGSAVEGDSIDFTVELSSAPSAQATVQYDTADGSGHQSATTGDNDYTAVSGGTVTFAAGETTETISIATGEDSVDEHDERFVVRLSSPSSNIALSELDSAAGLIINNDQTASSDSTLAGITVTDQDGNTIALNETFDPLRFVYTADAGAGVDTMNLSVSFGEGINPGYVRYFDAFGKVKEGNKSQAGSAEFSRIGPGVNPAQGPGHLQGPQPGVALQGHGQQGRLVGRVDRHARAAGLQLQRLCPVAGVQPLGHRLHGSR